MECVGHVQKRLGKKLRDLKKKTFVDDNGQVLRLKLGGGGGERTLDQFCHRWSNGLLRRGHKKFSRGRGRNAQSNLGRVPPLSI